MPDPRETPAMQQYYRFKRQHPDCVLMFRIGDFYEMFDEDAVKVARAIGLTLTQRTEGMPMCGVPHQNLDTYLRKLIQAGFRVAVCEQLAEASQVKGLVPRGVTRVITPGTAIDETLLSGESVNTLAAVLFTGSGDESPASLACVEVSTGEFTVADCTHAQIVDELLRRGTRELLFADPGSGVAPPRVKRVLDALSIAGTARPAWQFRPAESSEALREHFGVATFAGFGINSDEPVLQAAGAVIRYLKETQTLSEEDAKQSAQMGAVRATINHIRPPRREDAGQLCVIDAVSLRSLEVERTIRNNAGASAGNDGSLLGIFLSGGHVRTAMGKRLLRSWLCAPLRNQERIEERQQCVRALVEERTLAGHLGDTLAKIQDIARIAGRVSMARCTPRDVLGLATSIIAASEVAACLEGCKPFEKRRGLLVQACEQTAAFAAEVLGGLVQDPPVHLREGGVFKDGCDPQLDEQRMLTRDSQTWLSQYQAILIKEHNLPNLRVGYNSVFGYYIELPAAQARNAPAVLIRKQTLKNAERYITPELRDFETKVMNAQARGFERERALFAALCGAGAALLGAFAALADLIGEIDALAGLATKAHERRWMLPTITQDITLHVVQGRHPVLDESLGGRFVPNDVQLGKVPGETESNAARLALITGPNMAGKSTYIRQTALIVLLAHVGSYVPADSAVVGVTDRIFTRIGADDALHAGQSTFMVEMIETANILNNATERSLVVLDEVGRGTSTLDGLSLAWAIAEHLAGADPNGEACESAARPRALFATHYHELTDLEERLTGRVKNLHVAVREWGGGIGDDGLERHPEIVFLHRILPGRTDQSYGLHVARLAGMPTNVTNRGRAVLSGLAVQHQMNAAVDVGAPAQAEQSAAQGTGSGRRMKVPKALKKGDQLGLFKEYVAHPAVEMLREVKLDSLTPMQAFDALRKIKEVVDG